jgi:tRNA threonylcarbamoyladenosine biosynthesis protein TsaB
LHYKSIDNVAYSHGKQLHQLIKSMMEEKATDLKHLNAVAVSCGPGSYTGLRIGVAAAKGLCFALDIPLISIDTLTLLANTHPVEQGLKIAMMDARRMEVYCQVLDAKNKVLEPSKALVVDAASFKNILDSQQVTFIGSGAEKCEALIEHSNARFFSGIKPCARFMSALSYAKALENEFEDLAYFEPSYLKEFMIIPPKAK